MNRRVLSVPVRTHKILDRWTGGWTKGKFNLPSGLSNFVDIWLSVGGPHPRHLRPRYRIQECCRRTGKSRPSSPHLWFVHTRALFIVTQAQITGTDLYARGYSEAPDRPYDAHLYILQLALLMQYIGWDKADIVGFSMVCALAFLLPLRPIVWAYREEQSLQRFLLLFHTL